MLHAKSSVKTCTHEQRIKLKGRFVIFTVMHFVYLMSSHDGNICCGDFFDIKLLMSDSILSFCSVGYHTKGSPVFGFWAVNLFSMVLSSSLK